MSPPIISISMQCAGWRSFWPAIMAARRRVKFDFAQGGPEGRAVLNVRGLSKRFDEKVLFEDLSLQVQGGERVGTTGPNGTGKSMLLKSILGTIAAQGNRTLNQSRD